jgi:serine/threonine-protein kinase
LFPVPDTISHYEIQDKIGEGGMGVVYRALDLQLNRPVALKLISPSALGDPERVRRFVQEARTASALSHPNVAHIYEIGEADGARFIAMEYVEGLPLQAVLSAGPLPLSKTLDIAIQAADALSEAHSKRHYSSGY